MVVVSHLFLFLRKSFRGRFDLYESNLPLFGTIYFPTAPFLKQEDIKRVSNTLVTKVPENLLKS